MRALVLGQTGVEKKRYTDALVLHAQQKQFVHPDESERYARQFVQDYHIEEEIKAFTSTPTIQPFLDRLDALGRRATWRQVVSERILGPLKHDPPENVLLSGHAFFYRNSHFFTPLDWKLLKSFGPTIVLTLIDDCYDVVARINVIREKKGPTTQSKVNLAEALLWRSVEISAADLIANSFDIPHYVLAVKHPIDTGYRLLFEPLLLRIYASYPISSTRNSQSRIAEINEHRRVLHAKYTVFDPVCIDEYRAIPPKKKNGKWDHVPRWPLDPVMPAIATGKDHAPPVWRLMEKMESLIASQIEERDYRMINQADLVVAYRPFWGGREYPAQGVEKEILHAINTNKQVYYYDPPEDRKQRKKHAFQAIERGIRCKTKDDLYSQIDKAQSALSRP